MPPIKNLTSPSPTLDGGRDDDDENDRRHHRRLTAAQVTLHRGDSGDNNRTTTPMTTTTTTAGEESDQTAETTLTAPSPSNTSMSILDPPLDDDDEDDIDNDNVGDGDQNPPPPPPPPPPVVVHRRLHPTTSPSLPSSPSRGGLASSEEESVAELDDACCDEEVSVAELSVGAGSCSSVETMARNLDEDVGANSDVNHTVVDNNHNLNNNDIPLPSSLACLSPAAVVNPSRAPTSTSSTICSSSTTASDGAAGRPKLLPVPLSNLQSAASASASAPRGTSDMAMTAAAVDSMKSDSMISAAKTPPSEAPLKPAPVPLPLLSDIKIPAVAAPPASIEAGETTGSNRAQQQQVHDIQDHQRNNEAQKQQRLQEKQQAKKRLLQPKGQNTEVHRPMSLPKFPNPENCMWTSTHAANCPSEDRSSSLVNVLLQPLPPNFDSETQLPPLEPDYKTLIRLSLWSVIDGHGGGCVATYASEVLLPHIAASVSRALGCAIVDRGVCTVQGQLRDANALDLDGLIKTSDHRGSSSGNPNSIHYRSPFERSAESEDEDDRGPTAANNSNILKNRGAAPPPPLRGSPPTTDLEDNIPSSDNNDSTKASVPPCLQPVGLASPSPHLGSGSVSSVKTSVKTGASVNHGEALLGTHSPREVAAITQAITDSFLAVDEGWINSIDPVATHQTSCQSNGRWNSGACALVVFTIQRLDWTDVSGSGPGEHERTRGGPEKSRCHDTSQNRDAARRRMLDFASRAANSSMSTASSTSSLTTEEAVHASGLESEITETEGEDEDNKSMSRAEMRARNIANSVSNIPKKESLISAPGGCSCHCYRAHDAILYTAHVGDCRAVMLGSAPPRTIKVRDSFADHPDTTDDESSHHSSDETECLSSSDHDADSSEDDEVVNDKLSVGSKDSDKRASISTATSTTAGSSAAATPSYMSYMRRPVRRSRRRAIDDSGPNAPYYALPPLEKDTHRCQSSAMIELEIGDMERRDRRKQRALVNGPAAVATTAVGGVTSSSNNNGSVASGNRDPSDSSTSSQDSGEAMEPIHLPPVTRPIDLTTDHSAYNPAEVTAVLRRCSNAPRAISAGVGGGIKRVAGSLAVTRALGDAYLKTPRLSFLPYKVHAPYITARPEINCRPVSSTSDKVLILATDGVWERASGEDALRWVRNFYTERIAEAERRNKRRSTKGKATSGRDLPTSVILSPNYYDIRLAPASGNGSTLLDSSCNNSVTKGSVEATEQEQERQDDQNQKMDPQAMDIDTGGRSRGRKRDSTMARSPSPPSNKRRKRSGRRGNAFQCGWSRSSSVADVIVRRVLNKVRRARNISSLHALMSLPQGRARRSKHDDITASVVDLSAFVS